MAERTHGRSGSHDRHEQLLWRVAELAVRSLGALPIDVLPAYLTQRGTNAWQDDTTRSARGGTRDEAEQAREGTGHGAGVVWHVGHGLVEHIGVRGRGGRVSGRGGGEGCRGGGGGGSAEEDREGAPHDGSAVEVDVDHVVAALGDCVGDGVGSVAVVPDAAI